jgi:hypothetical protein
MQPDEGTRRQSGVNSAWSPWRKRTRRPYSVNQEFLCFSPSQQCSTDCSITMENTPRTAYMHVLKAAICIRGVEAGGSNPLTPTRQQKARRGVSRSGFSFVHAWISGRLARYQAALRCDCCHAAIAAFTASEPVSFRSNTRHGNTANFCRKRYTRIPVRPAASIYTP